MNDDGRRDRRGVSGLLECREDVFVLTASKAVDKELFSLQREMKRVPFIIVRRAAGGPTVPDLGDVLEMIEVPLDGVFHRVST
jgi:hypothetical protein